MHASEPPQMRSASAMVQASRGGLEKYPNAGSRDQAQYCASSKNRSTVENVRPARRMRVRTAMSAIARPRPGTSTPDRSRACDSDVISHPAEGPQIEPVDAGGQEQGAQTDSTSRFSHTFVTL